jgi:serine phosphatase RsbU (regulator of sigma subunit)
MGSKKIIIAADCTGHGVPGAFMSVLGITLLNDIIRVEKEMKPEMILNNLRERILKLFEKPEDQAIQHDGMDITVSIIDTNNHSLEFAGANNKIYIISGDDFHEIQGDKMPVGFSYSNEEFTTKSFQFNKGDSLYMFSDGYRDQFGGPKAKRFQSKRFKEVLVENNAMEMCDMEHVMHYTFEKWKGYHEQVDDVLVMGFRI